MTQPAITASVRVGGYALEVGTSAESFARFEPEPDAENAQALGAALAHEPDEHLLVEAVEGLQEDAAAVTNRVERANALFRAAAEGHLLDPASLTGEIDALLGLLGRLDRAGRFDEELRLARALSGLLAISLRWLELVRVLRAMLRSAQAAGSLPGQAWALHELGSLHLCAGNPETAAKRLDEALRLEQSLGNPFARCATRHNLDSARRDLALRAAAGGWPRRLLRLVGLVAVLALLGGAGTAIALAVGGGGGGAVTTSGHTFTSTTSSATDTSPPVVSLAAPVDGTTVTTPTPEFSGAAGTEPGDDPNVSVLVADDAGKPIEGFPRSAPVDGGSWMLTPTAAIADGSYSVSARQHDDAGHTGTSATNAFTIDTAAPALELDCPATIASPEKCTITSSDAGSARVDVYEVFSSGGIERESLLPDSPRFDLEAGVATSVTFTLPPLDPSGGVAFRVVAVQRDAAGNEGRSNSERIEPDVVQ